MPGVLQGIDTLRRGARIDTGRGNVQLEFRVHALQRMFERRISIEEVRHIVEHGEVIENYPDDKPYPSRLVLGWIGNRPIHVVVAHNQEDNVWIVVTAYEPDPQRWSDDFRQRRPKQ
ncbi:MAG: DUF4258 domain-containing protein [Ardenticatenia bacterium]|nr:MAG: DUF4258 domain-containing protein [Ardenticatenia bacterium]